MGTSCPGTSACLELPLLLNGQDHLVFGSGEAELVHASGTQKVPAGVKFPVENRPGFPPFTVVDGDLEGFEIGCYCFELNLESLPGILIKVYISLIQGPEYVSHTVGED